MEPEGLMRAAAETLTSELLARVSAALRRPFDSERFDRRRSIRKLRQRFPSSGATGLARESGRRPSSLSGAGKRGHPIFPSGGARAVPKVVLGPEGILTSAPYRRGAERPGC